ncbi:MAG: FlgD immunoglobulin-like domain containing protein [bacterium]
MVRFFCLFFCLLLSFPFRSDASDAIWSDTLSVSVGSDECRNPVVAVTGDTIWVAWETDRNGNWDIYARFYTDGSLSPSLKMTESDSSDLAPVLVAGGSGRLWFVWESKHSGLWKVYARILGGPTMTEAYPSLADTVGSLNPTAAVDRLNRLWIVWQSPGSMSLDSADVYGKYFDGVEWTGPFNITQHPANDGFPKVAADSAGNVWVVWQSDRTGGEDILATYFDGSAWLDPPIHVASGPSGDFTPQITVDSRGRVWFAWMSNFNIFTRYYDGQLSAVFQVTVGYFMHQSPRIVGDGSSNLWVVWTKQEDHGNIYARYYDGESWSTYDLAAAFEGDDRSPALAVDRRDNLWQVWDHDGKILGRYANIPPSPPASGFEPAEGTQVREQQPTIRWDSADEPTELMHYVVQLDDGDFETGGDFQYITEDGVTWCQVQDSLADNTHWFYRIQTVDPTELGSPWSEIQDFYVDLFAEPPHPPKNFTIVGLIDGEVKVAAPDFVWSYGGDNDPLDTAEETRYEVQIDNELCWCIDVTILGTAPGDTSAKSIHLEENKTYYARVQAIVDGEGLPSEWSDTLSFWINAENSAPTVEVLRPNGGEVWSGTDSIQWTATDLDDNPSTLTISIELSPDGGRSWESLPELDAAGDPISVNDGAYLWSIPRTLRGRNFLIQVTATDPQNEPSSDSSDGPFILSSMALDCQPRLFSPNGDGHNDEVTISFDLTEDSDVTVKVYDLAGRLVRLLKGNERVSVSDGQNSVKWDGRDEAGHIVPNRLYIVAATITDSRGSQTRTKTVVVLSQ